MLKKAFSVAEAMVALLIGSVALGFSAPLITKQIKANNSAGAEHMIMDRMIKKAVPVGAVMFFNLSTCPDGWMPLVDNNGNTLDGYYPRIAGERSPELGKTKEQMVHRHKHVSPKLTDSLGGTDLFPITDFRYGPYTPNSFNPVGPLQIYGDGEYEKDTHFRNYYMVRNYNGGILQGADNYLEGPNSNKFFIPNQWFAYTSDGMNNIETHYSKRRDINNLYEVKIPVCPNREENETICKKDVGAPFSFNRYNEDGSTVTVKGTTPYLKDMPLVGNENRPNSIVLLACQRIE